jgi:hypothetical protein
MRHTIHPFPARMAPEIALDAIRGLPCGSTVLDPMSGSGTVARQAVECGQNAVAFDLDPLAVLIGRVWTRKVEDEAIRQGAELVRTYAEQLGEVNLPWIDDDRRGSEFVEFWFGDSQRSSLRKLAYTLYNYENLDISSEVCDVLKVALSRIIVTKEQCASLARDTSHSRPHRVVTSSEYDVMKGFEQAVRAVRKRMQCAEVRGSASISPGDARSIGGVPSDSVDSVVTSPPYLNAIDYMRGHRLSLIWLGYSYAALTARRSASIGAERASDASDRTEKTKTVARAMGEMEKLPTRYTRMIERYVSDMRKVTSEVARVLKPNARATFVVGDSCLKGVFIKNSEAVRLLSEEAGLRLAGRHERTLPTRHRYLPTVGGLANRMRSELVLEFVK